MRIADKNYISDAMTADEKSYHAFLRAARRFWAGPLYRMVRDEALAMASATCDADLSFLGSYAGLVWLESSLQQKKYEGARGLLAIASRASNEISRQLLIGASEHSERLQLNEHLVLPEYYVSGDFHKVPDGIFARDTDGIVYEYAAGGTAMMANEKQDMHKVLAERIVTECPEDSESVVVDLGCGFGKLQGYLAERLPCSVRMIGCDLSAPVLRVAHLRALQRGTEVTWIQGAAEDMNWCASDSVDVASSIQLLHELPREVRGRVFAETYRVLKPGGWMIMVDFYSEQLTTFAQLLMRGHTVRNNEPYLFDILESPLADDIVGAGFAEASIESLPPGNSDPESEQWRLPWAMVLARKA